MKSVSLFIFVSLIGTVAFSQEGKFVFLKGQYIPYREDGRYKVNGETIFYKNERVFDGPGSNAKYTGYDVKSLATEKDSRPAGAGAAAPALPPGLTPEAAARILKDYGPNAKIPESMMPKAPAAATAPAAADKPASAPANSAVSK